MDLSDLPQTLAAGLWRRPSARAALVTLGIIAVLGVAAPPFLPDPAAQPDVISQALLPPGPGHPFGTDQLSRDVLARVVGGARVSLAVAGLAVLVSITIGAGVGLVAGYLGGVVDTVLMRVVDAALAIPRLFILLLLLAVWEHIPLAALIIILGTTGWFGTSRLVRGEVLRLRHQDFVSRRRRSAPGARGLCFGTCSPTRWGRCWSPDAGRRRCDPARGRPVLSWPRRPRRDRRGEA